MKEINFKHSGHLGDILYSLAYVKEICRINNAKANFYILNDGNYNNQKIAFHPSENVLVNQQFYDFIYPLLIAQSYIHKVFYYSSQEVPFETINLDIFRNSELNLSAGLISGWYRKVAAIPIPLELPWLSLPNYSKNIEYEILINKTTRYYNKKINYSFLDDFSKVGFIGLDYEYDNFVKRHGLKKILHVKTNTALELAEKLMQCQLFIGNQSTPFAIAEGLKINRALDVFEPVPNVIPIGGLCMDFTNTKSITYFLNYFFEKKLITNDDLENSYVLSILNEHENKKKSIFKKIRRIIKKLK